MHRCHVYMYTNKKKSHNKVNDVFLLVYVYIVLLWNSGRRGGLKLEGGNPSAPPPLSVCHAILCVSGNAFSGLQHVSKHISSIGLSSVSLCYQLSI